MFQDKNAQRFQSRFQSRSQSKIAEIFPNRFPSKNVRMSQDKNALRFQSRSQNKSAKKFQSNNAHKCLNKNAKTSQDKSAEMFQDSLARMFLSKTVRHSINVQCANSQHINQHHHMPDKVHHFNALFNTTFIFKPQSISGICSNAIQVLFILFIHSNRVSYNISTPIC